MELLDDQKLKDLEKQASILITESGELLKQAWNQEKSVSLKGENEPVTDFDIKTELSLREKLNKLLPEAGFLVEEGEDSEIKDYMWLIDPIDQTKNFIGQIPLFYIQLALTLNNHPLLGIIYNPISNQLFSASKNNQTKLNGELIPVRKFPNLANSIVDVDFGGNQPDNFEWKLDKLNKLARVAKRVRITGAAFSPYILTGGIDVYISINERTRVMDQLPRLILMQEAGLKCSQLEIEGRIVSLAAQENTFDEISNLLSNVN